jgi:hypothetical protein
VSRSRPRGLDGGGPGCQGKAGRGQRAGERAFEGVDGLGAGPHGGGAGDPQAADHLHLAGARLGQDRDLAGLHGLGSGPGVQGVGLALAASGLAVGSVDLDHDLTVDGQEAGQGGTVGAGALHPPGHGLSQLMGPTQQLLVAGRGGRDLEGGHRAAELVVGVGDMDLEVGVDPEGELGHRGVWMLVTAVSVPWPGGGWHARRPGGQHCEESGRQARIRSHPSGWRAGGGRGPGRQVNPKAPGPMTRGSDPNRSHHAVDRGGLSSGRQSGTGHHAGGIKGQILTATTAGIIAAVGERGSRHEGRSPACPRRLP